MSWKEAICGLLFVVGFVRFDVASIATWTPVCVLYGLRLDFCLVSVSGNECFRMGDLAFPKASFCVSMT